jgi:hypothetical protein
MKNSKAPKNNNNTRISAEEFVRAYLSGRTVVEVADRLKLTTGGVYSRANYMIKRGVRLPKLGRAMPHLNVDALNELVKDLSS